MKLINLLPKEKQQEIRYSGILHNLLRVLGITAASFAVVFLVQLGAKFFLGSEASSTQAQIQDLQKQVDKQDNAVLKQKISTVNNTVSDYLSLASSAPRWSNVLKAFAPLPPDGISVSSFTVDSQNQTIMIAGYAPTRDLVIQLHDNIENDTQHFYNIDNPYDNIAHPTDITFHFTFNVKADLLK